MTLSALMAWCRCWDLGNRGSNSVVNTELRRVHLGNSILELEISVKTTCKK